jgi:serine/threonine protein kinase
MTDPCTDAAPLETLLEDFVQRCREGESPCVSEYAARHPAHAERIEALFPAVAAMERFRAEERSKREALSRRNALPHPPGQLGDFHIIREIGRGGMGIVYEAEQRSLGRSVAVKVLPTHALLRGRSLQQFQREARTAARLQHTSIVPVFGVGEQDGLHYYVMPLVRGVGLDEIIQELRARGDAAGADSTSRGNGHRPPRDVGALVPALTARKFATRRAPAQDDKNETGCARAVRGPGGGSPSYWDTVARIGLQAAEALDHAHGQGTLHRDVKPSNLLLDEDGVVSVADFGLARALDDSDVSHSSDFAGTARYMAPEQMRGTADVRSDIYGLGMTLYELLTLQPAFDPRARAVFLRTGQGFSEPPRPRKTDPAIPRDLETVVLKCLANEPAKRYQTAAALAADLHRFLENRPILARRASPFERAGRWCRRNPALAAVSGLAMALLTALAVTGLASHLQMREAYNETCQALERAETTRQLSLDVLDHVYAKLSPERIWIASDADPTGPTCPCIGVRAGNGSATSVERTALQVRASHDTAILLESLLAFYDRLAAEGGNERCVMLQSAIASRRVGDIRLCLGRIDHAEQQYLRAVDKLTTLRARAPKDLDCATELARSYNELGNVRSARREACQAYETHQAALSVLKPFAAAERPAEDYRYELARTFYFLAGKTAGAPGGSGHADEYRQSAIHILEKLTRGNPRAPDYRWLLALCRRDTGAGPEPAGNSWNSESRRQAIGILEGLVAEYPDVADYRYELIATYAWTPVGLCPQQERFAVSAETEQSLRKAIDQSEWLVAHNPTVPHYARCKALVLAKLGAASWGSQRLAEAENFFEKAVAMQSALVAKFPDSPPHDQALLGFFRLQLAQIRLNRNTGAKDRGRLGTLRQSLEQCIEGLGQLAGRSDLADDQLVRTSLPLAYDTLGNVLDAFGETDEAKEARRKAATVRKYR